MTANQISDYFCQNGWEELTGNVPKITVNYRMEGDYAYVLVHFFIPNGNELSLMQMNGVRRQINDFFLKKAAEVKLLSVLYTEYAEQNKSDCLELGSCWIYDMRYRRLIIYSDQPSDFNGSAKLLEDCPLLAVPWETAAGEKEKAESLATGRSTQAYGFEEKRWKSVLYRIPVVTIALVVVNIIIFLLTDLLLPVDKAYEWMIEGGLFWPSVLQEHEIYRLFTYQFLHADIEHVINNMFLLLVLGSYLERAFGRWNYLITYFSSGILAGVVSIVYNSLCDSVSWSIGASGAVFGIVGAMVVVLVSDARARSQLSFGRVIFFIGISLYGGFTSKGIDNAAHIGGLIGGGLVAVLLVLIGRIRKRRKEITRG